MRRNQAPDGAVNKSACQAPPHSLGRSLTRARLRRVTVAGGFFFSLQNMPDCRLMATGKKDGDREAELKAAIEKIRGRDLEAWSGRCRSSAGQEPETRMTTVFILV